MSMITNVVIDDERTFALENPNTVHLRSSAEALAWLSRWWTEWMLSSIYDDRGSLVIYLDHDLGEDDDIMIVVYFLHCLVRFVDADMPVKHVYVHTQNPIDAENIMRQIKGLLPRTRIPLPDLEENQ